MTPVALPADTLVGIGANLGERGANLDHACAMIAELPYVEDFRHTTWHESESVGGPVNQPPFLNGACRFRSMAGPDQLLLDILQIETKLGRERPIRWGPRLVDLDLLLFDSVVLRTESLTIPHPWMAIRRFVLEPAMEIAADMRHPQIGWSVAQLAEHLRKIPPVMAVTGAIDDAVRDSIQRVAHQVAGRVLLAASIDPGISDRSGSSERNREARALARRQALELEIATARTPILADFWWEEQLPVESSFFQELPTLETVVVQLVDSESNPEQRELWQRVSRHGRGPWMRFSAGEQHRWEHDLLAIVRGMS